MRALWFGKHRRPLLPAIRVPTLVMHGGDDRLVPVSCAREVAARVPGAQIHIFEGSGHLLVSAGAASVMVLWSFISAPTPS